MSVCERQELFAALSALPTLSRYNYEGAAHLFWSTSLVCAERCAHTLTTQKTDIAHGPRLHSAMIACAIDDVHRSNEGCDIL
jgi:hypothetical protein